MDVHRPLIEQNWHAFQPHKVTAVRHCLQTHPLLQRDELLLLARRMEMAGQLLQIDQDVTASTTFITKESTADALQRIGEIKGWAYLRFVQKDADYRKLVDTVLDSIQAQVQRHDPGMHHRAGFVFISSQRMVTPFHIDSEHNFILQMQGHKTLYVWDPDDLEVVSELARDRFHHTRDRELLRWREEFRHRAHVFQLRPGTGAYMPATSPHMVEAGDDLSVTMSFTYYTDATRRDARLHRLHNMVRSIGIEPPPVGAHPVLDRLSGSLVDAVVGVRRLEQRLLGRDVAAGKPPYAGMIH